MGEQSAETGAVLTPEQRQRFLHAAEAALRVRRNILLLAAHASGHRKHPHGESCDACNEVWPCAALITAAGPSLGAVADLPSQHPQLGARALREAASAVADELGSRPTASAIIRWLTSRAERIIPPGLTPAPAEPVTEPQGERGGPPGGPPVA